MVSSNTFQITTKERHYFEWIAESAQNEMEHNEYIIVKIFLLVIG